MAHMAYNEYSESWVSSGGELRCQGIGFEASSPFGLIRLRSSGLRVWGLEFRV